MKKLLLLILTLSLTASAQPMVFDATWGKDKPTTMPASVHPMLWAMYAVYSHGTEKTTVEQIERFAAAKRDGATWDTWNGPIKLDPSSVCCLDMEADFTGGNFTYAESTKLFEAYRRTNPGNRLTTYGGFPGLGRRDWWTIGDAQWVRDNPDAAKVIYKSITDEKKTWGPTFDSLDLLCFDVYLLRPQQIEADLSFIKAVRLMAKRYYPGHDYAAWTTGCYTWDQPQVLLNETEMARYYDAIIAAKYDAIVVWGEWSYAGKWLEYVVKRQAMKLESE